MDKIYFTVNGDHYTLSGAEVSPSMSLSEYLRESLQLYGTKTMCHEGGCGACVVSVSHTHPVTKETHVFAVNSCLVHILSCHQWDITTVEGVGNRRDGYHAIQRRLAAFNGTQCGYCTPGWVMNMYSLYKTTNGKLTTEQVENSFGGNMCRCTGYRPILDAFKTFATDTDKRLKDKLRDMEDMGVLKCNERCGRKCSECEEWCVIQDRRGSLLDLRVDSTRWYKAYTVEDVFRVLTKEGTDSYKLIAGNTGKGVFPAPEALVQIDISSVAALKDTLQDVNLVLGAGMSLTELMTQCQRWARHNDEFKYLDTFYQHLDLVAHVPVRNMGTIGGNLAMKNKHREFPSDIFLLLETVGASVTLLNATLDKQEVGMQEFLQEDLTNRLILDVKVPPLSPAYLLRTYKIMPRAQNAHAIVNAGFLFKVDSTNRVMTSRVVFGAIAADFVRASGTEGVLQSRSLFSDDTLQTALVKLKEELVPADMSPEPSPFCRKTLALGLFYKAILSLCPDVAPRYRSGGALLERGVSRGTQTFDTDKALWPLNQPVPKLEALAQCAGEVRYACDVSMPPRGVHVAFVLSTTCGADILSFDASAALKAGVVAFFTSKDIPGKNSFFPSVVPWQDGDEEILASSRALYYGQPVALIAALTPDLAFKAAKLVKVNYKKSEVKPVLTIKDALRAPDKDRRVREEVNIAATQRGSGTTHVITGSYSVQSQYHYTMETQSCSVSHSSRGLRVRSSTQWMDLVHVAVAQSLALPQNRVEVVVGRVGGAYGGKASRSALVACACALVAHKLHRSAALVMPLTHNMAAIGKRNACHADYEVGVDDAGVIQYVQLTYYSECGSAFNDSAAGEIASTLTNLYASARWSVLGYSVLTDKPSNTWCRAPSTTEATAILEHIMERIAQTTGKDPIDIRLQHLAPEHASIRDMVTKFRTDCAFDQRCADIEKFNSENAWRKRGLKMSLMSYPIGYSGNFPVTVSVYHGDGTVEVAHGGIEMGQGINTKVAQVCAYTLKIPLAKVSVRGSDSFVSPNSMASNGSITSECVAHGAALACQQLRASLEAGYPHATADPAWEELVADGYRRGVNLQASHMTGPLDALVGYSVHGACACEVELDVLTGAHLVRRVDLLEDTGVSLSPDIDVGQIEGAFVMGLGLWTCERLVFAPETGRLLTDRTWTYKPPGARDIPQDFRVSFRRDSRNTAGVLRSKATGEPALVLAVAVTHALRHAVLRARKEFGYKDTEWLHIDTPFCVENILKAISPKIENYKLK